MSRRAVMETTGSGRGPAGRGETRRKAMLDAACDLFLEHGFEGTSVGDVVKRSGGSLATLYAWFGSKEGLFEAIIGEISSHLLSEMEAPDFEARPLDEALRSFGESFLHNVLSSKAVLWYRMAVAEGHKFPELREALLRQGSGRVNERLAAYLTLQARAGRLRIEDATVAAAHFFALVKSETHTAAVCGEHVEVSRAELKRQVRRAVEVFLHGYAADREWRNADAGAATGASGHRGRRGPRTRAVAEVASKGVFTGRPGGASRRATVKRRKTRSRA